MPPSNGTDISDDLKRTIVSSVQSGISYRQLSKLTGVSVGAISGIMKVRNINFFWGGGGGGVG